MKATFYLFIFFFFRWAGLQDGRFTAAELAHGDGDHITRILACDTLIIDEVSMLSRHVFDTVEQLCRAIRGSSMPFGGIQVILAGKSE